MTEASNKVFEVSFVTKSNLTFLSQKMDTKSHQPSSCVDNFKNKTKIIESCCLFIPLGQIFFWKIFSITASINCLWYYLIDFCHLKC
jgi:hypothetical protein